MPFKVRIKCTYWVKWRHNDTLTSTWLVTGGDDSNSAGVGGWRTGQWTQIQRMIILKKLHPHVAVIGFIRSGSCDPRTEAVNDRVKSRPNSLSVSPTYFLTATDLNLELPGHVLGLLFVLLHLLLGLPHLLLEDIEKVATLDLCHDCWTDCAGSAHSTD